MVTSRRRFDLAAALEWADKNGIITLKQLDEYQEGIDFVRSMKIVIDHHNITARKKAHDLDRERRERRIGAL